MGRLALILVWCIGTASAQDIRIEPGAIVYLSPGEKLLAPDDLSVDGQLVLDADTGRYSQLKIDGLFLSSVTMPVQQMQGLKDFGWHLFSSPFLSGFSNPINLIPNNLYAYSGSQWLVPGTNTQVPGLGFFGLADISSVYAALSASNLFGAEGQPNTSVSVPLYYTPNQANTGSGTGWNLVGNPFTCTLDFGLVSKAYINDAYYIWSPSQFGGIYLYYAQAAQTGGYLHSNHTLTGEIPPFQGFWVQATQANASLDLDMASQCDLSLSTRFLKNKPDNLILHVTDVSDSNKYDLTWIAVDPTKALGFDGSSDAWKMTNTGDVPNVWTEAKADRLAVNALDFIGIDSVPIGLSHPSHGTLLTFSLEQVTSGNTYPAILEDRLLNTYTDLTKSNYLFSYEPWTKPGTRFLIRYRDYTMDEAGTPGPDHQFNIRYQSEIQSLILSNPFKDDARLILSDLSGRIILAAPISSGLATIPVQLAQGAYVARIESQSEFAFEKFSVIR